jgi:hypothetical protein
MGMGIIPTKGVHWNDSYPSQKFNVILIPINLIWNILHKGILNLPYLNIHLIFVLHISFYILT